MTPNRWLLVGAVVVLAAVGVVGAWRFMRGPTPLGAPASVDVQAASGELIALQFFKSPTKVPTFSVRTLDGKTVSSTDFAGKVVLINFWATWCGPCRAELPMLTALQERYKDKLLVLGISEDEEPESVVRQFATARNVTYPVAMATPDTARLFPGITALPTTFVVDRDGMVVQRHVGMLHGATTEAEFRTLAGLPANVTIEKIDDEAAARRKNAAEATEIPGVDLSKLTPAQKAIALKRLNTDLCTCGCKLTLAQCRIDDSSCGISLPLARTLVAQVAAGK